MFKVLSILLAFAGVCAQAAELKLLTAGAFKPVAVALLPAFEAASGHSVKVENDTAGGLLKRIRAGERFDVVVLTPAALAELAKEGRVDAAATLLARVAIGVAVKQGAPLPDISTVAAFEASLRAANKVAMIDPAAGGSSGIYLAGLFEKMGLSAHLKPKSVLVPGGLVATRVVNGEADLAIHQISEILAVPGAVLVGPLPKELQNYTVYAGARASNAHPAAASLLEALKSTQAAAVLKEKGMESAAP